MSGPLRLLVADSEPREARETRRESVGRSSGETYIDRLSTLVPDATFDRVKPGDREPALPGLSELGGYDAVFLTGSPLHLYDETPETRRQIEFMRDVFASGTPAFGSCAGLQVASVAAGGRVRPRRSGHEAAFARRITRTNGGIGHPLLAGRPDCYDALAIHSDEVDTLPDGGMALATNTATAVQAAEIRVGHGIFWGVQYHPELSLGEIAAALRRQSRDLVREGFADSDEIIGAHADLIAALHDRPERRDLAWRLGIDEEITDPGRRTRELRNFVDRLVLPTRSRRGRA